MKIVTSYDPKPIPCRDHDWSAIDSDGYDYDSPVGYGPTEAVALIALLELLPDSPKQDALISMVEEVAWLG